MCILINNSTLPCRVAHAIRIPFRIDGIPGNGISCLPSKSHIRHIWGPKCHLTQKFAEYYPFAPYSGISTPCDHVWVAFGTFNAQIILHVNMLHNVALLFASAVPNAWATLLPCRDMKALIVLITITCPNSPWDFLLYSSVRV